eukprot:NODE_1511_length_831_cov_42.352273_g1463_i0.p1 GENE.NODE_1511_length_831_cov_42.352273_g1463_i0~~NODE_1511_length_831_cov_42.352273_g1463_i0.p1  ORF type:complete len:259 (+),score=53.53 NODE_1511_length_831_cov_42.352273_g1463_i0:105-779(+)
MSGLNDEEVKAEMQKMVRFIKQEAYEKANEITARAQEEFQIEKGNLVTNEKIKIKEAYERKMKHVELQKKIMFSNKLNQSRLKILQSREQVVDRLFQEAKSKLATIAQDQSRYGQLLKGLILQGLYQLLEENVTVICREQDVILVNSVLGEAAQQYQSDLNRKINLTVDNNRLDSECSGGVILSSHGGRIRAINTLDARLDMLERDMLPEIRETLFGANPNRVS